METKLFEPKAQPKDLRNMRRRSQRLPNEYPTYKMIPSDEVMHEILTRIAVLNGAIKFPEFPIRKSPFYQLKTRIIQYVLTLIRAKQAPDTWAYAVNGVEVNPGNEGHYLAAIELVIAGERFQFHTPIDNSLMCIIFQQLYQQPVKEFYADDHMPLDVAKTIEIWEELLTIFEDSDWFIYEQQIVHGWVDVMRNWYPHLGIKMQKGTNCKIATMLAGGPMMQTNGSDWCKFYELRDNFSTKLEALGHKHDFRLNLKK